MVYKNKNKNALMGLAGVLILGALIYFVFLKKKSCKSQSDCLHGLVCHNKKCVACSADVSCPGGLVCHKKKCVACSADVSCPSGLTCQSGICGK